MWWSALSESQLTVPPCGWSHLPENGWSWKCWKYRCDASLSSDRDEWWTLTPSAVTSLTDPVMSASSLLQPVCFIYRHHWIFPLPVALAFLGLHQHCFQFLNWDVQRHKEISWLSKRRGSIKNACGCFLSLQSHQWLHVDNTISHHGNELGWAHSLWMPNGFLFRMAIVSFLNRWKPGRVTDNLQCISRCKTFDLLSQNLSVPICVLSTLALAFKREH